MSNKFGFLQSMRESPETPAAPERRRGRPRGKRSNPEYEQVTIYIRRDTHQDAKIVLLKAGRLEFSDLVQRLVAGWLQPPKTKAEGQEE